MTKAERVHNTTNTTKKLFFDFINAFSRSKNTLHIK